MYPRIYGWKSPPQLFISRTGVQLLRSKERHNLKLSVEKSLTYLISKSLAHQLMSLSLQRRERNSTLTLIREYLLAMTERISTEFGYQSEEMWLSRDLVFGEEMDKGDETVDMPELVEE